MSDPASGNEDFSQDDIRIVFDPIEEGRGRSAFIPRGMIIQIVLFPVHVSRLL
jgi:hypothetical protein